jgi:hypothetical protein
MAKKPNLETLCKQVVTQAGALAELFSQLEPYFWGSDGVRRTELLGKVCREVSRMERTGAGVPKSVRRLRSALQAQAGRDQLVLDVFDGVYKALRNFSNAHAVFSGGKLGGGEMGAGEGLAPETPSRILRHHVLEVLRELGGRAKVGEIFDAMECRLGAGLLAGDVRPDAQGVTTWRRNVGMLRYELVAEGVLRSDRATGVWELGKKAKC